ncbi:MAG: rRNA maturation RNase YbeY [Acidobacteriota bacterium]
MLKIVDEIYSINKNFYLEKLKNIIAELKLTGTITIKLGSKEESWELNKRYRKKDYPTDVLSFPINENFPDTYYLGDIFICYPIVEEQAKNNNVDFKKELFSIMCHGVLHLGGFDHETDSGEMMKLQDQMVAKYF